VSLSDLSQALTAGTVLEDSDPVDVEWPPADMPAFQAGAAHPCSHPLDDEIPFEFCDGADDDHDGPPERGAGIKILAEGDELDVEMIEFVDHFEEVPDGSGDTVRGPDHEHLEAAAARIPKQIIETRSTSFSPGDPIGVLGNDLNPAAGPSRGDHRAESPGAGRHWIRADKGQQFSYLLPDRGHDIPQEARLQIQLKQIVDVWLGSAELKDGLQLV
jgi:hypothetical protein